MTACRTWTNRARKLIDEFLPPFVRDSALFGLMLSALAGRNAALLRTFKQRAMTMSESDFAAVYDHVRGIERATDLNEGCIAAILDNVTGATVLDAGCGRGHLARLLAQRNLSVTAVDVHEPRIDGVRTITAPIENLAFDDASFDTVICAHTLEHVRDIPRCIGELRRVARTRLILVVPQQRPYRVTPDLHVSFFPYEANLRAAIGLRADATCRTIDGDWFYVEDCG